MKKLIVVINILFLSLGFTNFAIAKSSDELIDSVAAVVNKKVIVESQLRKKMVTAKQQMQAAQAPTLPEKEIRKEVLNHMINAELQLQAAKRFGIKVDNDRLNHVIEDIAKRNHVTLAQFYERIARDGFTKEEFRNQIRQQVLISELQHRAVGKDISVTDQEIKKLLTSKNSPVKSQLKYHVEDLLINLPENPSKQQTDQIKMHAKQILAKVKKGTKMASLAKDAVPGAELSAVDFSDLGVRKLSDLPKVFSDALKRMKKGQVKGLIKAPNGYHILRVVDIQKEGQHFSTMHNVRHILIKTDKLTNDKKAKAKLINLRNKLVKTKDFSSLAKKYSQDPNSATKGGKLGWLKISDLDPKFAAGMVNLKVYEISQPIQSRFGWHIVQVLERKNVDDSDKYLKQQAKKHIYKQKYEKALAAWLKELREKAYIKVMQG